MRVRVALFLNLHFPEWPGCQLLSTKLDKCATRIQLHSKIKKKKREKRAHRSASLIWHDWSCKKVSFYPNVIFLIMCHFGLKCWIIEVFQENGLFQCKLWFCVYYEDTYVWRNIGIIEICSQQSPMFSKAPQCLKVFPMYPQGSLTCSKVLLKYEPSNTCGSHNLCTLITSIVWQNWT